MKKFNETYILAENEKELSDLLTTLVNLGCYIHCDCITVEEYISTYGRYPFICVMESGHIGGNPSPKRELKNKNEFKYKDIKGWLEYLVNINNTNKPKRKFFKTTFTLEILSEEPLKTNNIDDVINGIRFGYYSGGLKFKDSCVLNGEEMAKELINQGRDPEFFCIDENDIN